MEGPGEATREVRERLRGSAAVKAHVTLALGVALCAVAFWFELGRALGGNALSWAYVFEWPLLAVFAVYMWWKVIHPGAAVKSARPRAQKPAVAPEFAGMLAAWQQHHTELAAEREREERDAEEEEEES